MSIDKSTNLGKIKITLDAVASVVGESIKNVFGVVGLGAKRTLRDNINVFLNKEFYKEGVVCKQEKGQYVIDVYIVCSYGVKVSEVIAEVSKQVRYNLEKTFDIRFRRINVFVQNIVKD